MSFVHCAAKYYLGAARPHCSCLCARLSFNWLLRPELAAQDVLQGELQSAVQMRGDLQRERGRCRGAQGHCKQVAEESAKVVPSCSSVVCADAAAASRMAVIVSLVLLQAIAAESCSCCLALTSACVR